LSSPPGGESADRRTRLAAERTWLAWWRSGVAAATASVGVGGVVPELVDSARTAYVILGAGYALLAAAVFVGAGLRQRRLTAAVEEGEYEGVPAGWVTALTVSGGGLALATLAIIIVNG
jgi:putative membrane protein